MSVLEAVRLAIAQIRVQKLKSFFTLVGVSIGVMFLIAVVSIVNGMSRYMEDDLIGKLIAPNSFELRQRPNIQLGDVDEAEWRAWRARQRITEDDVGPVVDALSEGVRWAVVGTNQLVLESRFARPRQVQVSGVGGSWFEIKNMGVTSGRLIADQEYRLGTPVVVVGDEVARHFFPALDPIGRELRIGKVPYTVIGVAEKQGSTLGLSLDRFVVLPFDSPAKRLLNRTRVIDALIVQAPTEPAMQASMEEVRQVMRIRHRLRPGQPDDFSLQTADSALAFWKRIERFLVLAGVALPTVGLLVGAIVIMNIMLVAVAERTREIGIRKALGARRMDILMQFIAEAVTLSLIGAAIGVAGGAVLAKLVSAASPLPASVALWSVATAVLVGAGVGIISGVYPASRAALLDPIAALRQE
ncbi:MAG TPA: ABC transporter permease [Gemmatimonadaceae bacterium]|nr:ABC transporter permease [Gemmatimonadaceae bacterium]